MAIAWGKILVLGLLFWLWGLAPSWAESLGDRLGRYPQWQDLPVLNAVQPGTDLIYPEWFTGTWQATSILLDQVAPLAPEVVTPGFAANEKLIGQPFSFRVKFQPQASFMVQPLTLPQAIAPQLPIVADRAFNGREIAQAYLGTEIVQRVEVDPQNPNRQLTILKGDRRLISTVTGRAQTAPKPDQFLSSELTQQQFQNAEQVYLNRVETTTDYQRIAPDKITANQVTAIYLSPNDPDFFKAQNKPVALYHYSLDLVKLAESMQG
ncbi:DUF6816 family protein [Picosynechococcus sp. NKBG15041c]|uniref:DUF6816 family protein n=1 Tax=Picosynechococcus sp. NKBG15041c TaxID=1407650 RepID=UPI000410C4B6|nr:hypothetical protein [Picosynechococcus sp. NKBG15041c]